MAGPPSPSSRLAAIVVAAGQGLRARQPLPKQFAPYRGSTVLRVAVEKLREGGVGEVAVVIPEGADQVAAQQLEGIAEIQLVTGGATRQDSVRAGLEALVPSDPSIVLVHDAARPDCPPEVIERLVAGLADANAAIPVLPVADSMLIADGSRMERAADREALRRVQTPQAFRFADLLAAHRAWLGETNAGDDAQVMRADGHEVKLVEGDERLGKLTYESDFANASSPAPRHPRTGTGFDVHRMVDWESLWLAGVEIPYHQGLSGHSDADVGLHAIVDAILGACALGDIGDHFPPSDPTWKGARSARFVEHAVELAAGQGYRVGNADLTLICEAPKIGPHKQAMRAALAALLQCPTASVSVKATTTERLGFTGRGEGVAAQAVVTMVPA